MHRHFLGKSVRLFWIFLGLFFLGIGVPGTSLALEATPTEDDDRYARIVVTVSVADNSFEARKGALRQAREEGVLLWLEALLGTLSSTEQGYFLDRISQYTSSAKVLKETALVHAGELSVEVLLDTRPLRFDAATVLFPQRKTPVLVVFILGEDVAGAKEYRATQDTIAPRMLRDVFLKTGFEVYTQAELDQKIPYADMLRCVQEGAEAATRLGRALDAEVIVFGETKSFVPTSETAGPQAVRATSDLMVIRVHDGQVLERVQTEASVAGTNIHAAGLMAIEDAVYKAQNRIVVAAALGSLTPPERTWIRLSVQGQNVQGVSDSLGEYLENLSPISTVELLHHTRNELVYSVHYRGKISALVADIVGDSQGVVRLDPVKIVDEEMTFRLLGHE